MLEVEAALDLEVELEDEVEEVVVVDAGLRGDDDMGVLWWKKA